MEGWQLIRRRDMRPLLFRLGIALALSLAGYLRFRPRPRPRGRLPSSPQGPSAVAPKDAAAVGGLADQLSVLTHEETLAKIINGTSPTITTTTIMELSPSGKSSGEEKGFLLPEFNQLVVKEFDESGRDPEDSPTSPASSKSEIEDKLVMEQEIEDKLVMEQEIAYLRNLVESLRERERTLEIQLLEYHGLREQNAAAKELENRLKIKTTEAKLISLKLDSLRAENQRLCAQVSDYSRVVTELESVRANIQLLKSKLREDGEQAKEKTAALQERVAMLQDKVHEHGEDSAEVEEKQKKLKELEDEAMDLREVNSRLAQENSELKLKLRSIQMPNTSAFKDPEAKLLEEANHLREENDKLKMAIEQLHTDRCSDVEELVYLKWINACLRYELRNYQPRPGKTVARDLSMRLSPKSEQKAKQLIVEYANFDIDERNMSLLDLDFDYYSSSQASNEDNEDTLTDVCSTTKSSSSRKSKFISKLKKLVSGKDRSQKAFSADKTPTSRGNCEIRESVSPCSFEDGKERGSNDSFSSCVSVELASANQTGIYSQVNEICQNKGARPQSFSRTLDIHRPRRLNLEETRIGISERCKSDVGTSFSYRSLLSGDDSLIDLSPKSLLHHLDIDVTGKVELRKFAEVLNSSLGSSKLKKRAVSFSFN